MPRPKLTDRPVAWKIYIPNSVAAEVELYLVDEFLGKSRHGAKSDLVTQLLREWLAKTAKAQLAALRKMNEVSCITCGTQGCDREMLARCGKDYSLYTKKEV